MTCNSALNQYKAGGSAMILPDNLTNCGAGSPYAAGKVQLHPWFHIAFDRLPKG